MFVKGLRELGLDCPEPSGAFYEFPSIRRSGPDSETFAERLLHKHQVAVVPGNVFGAVRRGHVRCSYATALPLLEEALERMGGSCVGLTRPNRRRLSPRCCEHVSTRRTAAGRVGNGLCLRHPRQMDAHTHPPTDPPCPGCGRHRATDDDRGFAWASEHAPDGTVT